MDNDLSHHIQRLREKAQARLNEGISDELTSELELHQMELEVQYEELQRAYNEVRSLHEEFWSLYEFAPCGYITLNHNGIITRINQQGKKLLGTEQSPLTCLGFSRFIAPEYQFFFFHALKEGKYTGEKQSLELELLRRDQSRLWVHLDLQMRVNEQGELQQWQLTLTDITPEKEGEKARAKAARLELINDSIRGGIAYIDREQRYQFVNKTYQEWLGKPATEIIGKTITEILGAEAYAKIHHHVTTAFKGETVTYECQIPCSTIVGRDVLVTLVPDWNENKAVEGFYVLTTDITQNKQREAKIAEQEEFLRSIYEGIEQAIFVWDVTETGEFRWVDLNLIAQALIGRSNSQVRGQNLATPLTPELASQFRDYAQNCLTQGKSIRYEGNFLHENKNETWLMTLTPLRNEAGEFYRIIGTGVNIQDRKQLEWVLREQAEREQLLHSITRSMRQSLDLEAIATHSLSKIRELFAVNRALLAVAKPGEAAFEVVRLISDRGDEEISDPTLTACDYTLAETLFQTYSWLVVSDVDDSCVSSELKVVLRQWNARSLLAMPIWSGEVLQGAICLQVRDQVRHWTENEQELMKEITNQLAIALRQSQLYEQLNAELRERRRLQDQLRYDAIHDQLTGLPNRMLLMDRLEEMLASTPYTRFAVLFLDLNRFKAVNDTFGHTVGDKLLIIVSQRLQDCLREKDLLVRFGGDEFVIVLDDISAQNNAIQVANRIHQALTKPVLLQGVEVTIGTSIGIVMDDPNYTDPTPILRDADIAMYEAKNNDLPYVIFEP